MELFAHGFWPPPAQAVLASGFVGWAIAIVLIAAVVALVVLALRQFGIVIPGFVVTAFWICVTAVVIILAILFVARIAGWA